MRPLDSDNRTVWRGLRALYTTGLVLLFGVIAFYFGPNRLLFHKWTWIRPEDFVTVVQRSCVPTVRAMKIFALTHGRLPHDNKELGPAFADWRAVGYVSDGRFSYVDFTHGFNEISYKFEPGNERWMVWGYFLKSELPCPPVTATSTANP